ncbi:MAG: ethanolamine utilization protein, partial [Burkholderiaceae bacterium]
LDPDVLDTLPKTAGVYLFNGDEREKPADDQVLYHAEEPRPLYIGKAKNLRQRVMAHFSGDHLSAREMEISQQMTRIEWIETGGGTQQDLGALLTEATLVKARMPAYNRQLRKSEDVCAWRLVVDRAHARWKLAIARPDDLFFAQDRDLYGPFVTPRQAAVTLSAIADAHGLCPALLKLEKAHPGKPCFSHQVKRCRGACIGLETIAEHTERLQAALASLALVPWPFPGAIAFREGSRLHVVNGWAYLGMASSDGEVRRLATRSRLFDHDIYRLLVRRVEPMRPKLVHL